MLSKFRILQEHKEKEFEEWIWNPYIPNSLSLCKGTIEEEEFEDIPTFNLIISHQYRSEAIQFQII